MYRTWAIQTSTHKIFYGQLHCWVRKERRKDVGKKVAAIWKGREGNSEWGREWVCERSAELEALECRNPHASFITLPAYHPGFLGGASGKEPACQFRRHKRYVFDPWVRKVPWHPQTYHPELRCQVVATATQGCWALETWPGHMEMWLQCKIHIRFWRHHQKLVQNISQ